MELSVCVTDADYEAWRAVRIAVLPYERCASVAEMRAQDSAERLLLLATVDGAVIGSGLGDRSDTGGGFAAPRVLAEHRRQGVGSALLRALAEHVGGLGETDLKAMVDDDASLAFAVHFGFVERDRQIEQVRAVGAEEEPPPALPDGVEIVPLDQRPELWAESYERFGTEVLADFALYEPLRISAEQWASSWPGDPMFLAVSDGEVIGCAGIDRDTDRPERGENALTAVRRDWRGRGLAVHLKRRTLQWAAAHELTEVYTWTQAGNTPMLTLNTRLGYRTGRTSISLSRTLPL